MRCQLPCGCLVANQDCCGERSCWAPRQVVLSEFRGLIRFGALWSGSQHIERGESSRYLCAGCGSSDLAASTSERLLASTNEPSIDTWLGPFTARAVNNYRRTGKAEFGT